MSKKYTAAIVGCGSIGNAHMDGYRLNDNVEVVAVADPLLVAREEYMEKYDIPQGYATVEEMLEKAKPDIVSVCTWPSAASGTDHCGGASRGQSGDLRKTDGDQPRRSK